MSYGRDGHTATVLQNGKVLVAGGYSDFNGWLTRAEIYDPATNTWTATGSMHSGRSGHTATLLIDGKVLVAGGESGCSGCGTAGAELFNPATGLWSTTGPLSTARVWQASARLPNGKVIVAGGYLGASRNEEIYDPAQGVWIPIAGINQPRTHHQAASLLLSDGRMLVAGGDTNGYQSGVLSSTEIYPALP